MGSIFSRENAGVEEFDSSSNNAYRYPPKSGNYFGNHFIMGGEKFDTTQPEAYLFGENMDLNFLGSKPTPFPYPAPQPQEPTRTLRSLINIRKESLRFVRATDSSSSDVTNGDNPSINTSYNIEFTFDSDVRCGITILYFCTEDITLNGVVYTPQDASMNSETYHYKRGVNQQFSQLSHVFDPGQYSEDMLNYKFEDQVIPVLIQCMAEEGEEPRQSHMVLAVVEKNADGTYTLKPLKQKLFVDGLCYLLQEIYGIENKNVYQSKDITDEDVEDSGSDCCVCMSNPKDTLILPCRHLCLCNSCADSLRFQANNCPICRAPFRALLQIRAVRKTNNVPSHLNQNSENLPSQDIPPGYEPVSLIEALNGPSQPSPSILPSFVPAPIPPFGKSPDIRQKHLHRHIDRHNSSSTSLKMSYNSNNEKGDTTSENLQRSLEGVSVPEISIPSVLSSDKSAVKTECLSLTRGEGRRHRKGSRTSSAPEKIRLLANSFQIVNEVGATKRKVEKDTELAETRSLLESNAANEEIGGVAPLSPQPTRPCSSSPISLSTPHSLHLCEKSCKEPSSGGDDSDYFTPEDPSTTILVDQGTDTSLDTSQGVDQNASSDLLGKVKNSCTSEKPFQSQECCPMLDKTKENESDCLHSDPLSKSEGASVSLICKSHSLVVNLENPNSLPGTPGSNFSNHSSADSSCSNSSTRLLLRPHSCETLPE